MPFLQRILGENLGVKFVSSFRKRYYVSENYFCKKQGVKPLPFDVISKRIDELNGKNFSSEIWFINLLRGIDGNIFCKRNFPVLNRFFADFLFSNINLVVEIDGKSHENSKDYDDRRDFLFKNRGLKVIRIKYGDLKKAQETVDKIVNLHKRPSKKTKKKSKNRKNKNKANKTDDVKIIIMKKHKAKFYWLKKKKIHEHMNELMLAALKK